MILKTEPANNGQIFLNQSVKIFFSNPIDLSTANFNTVAFLVRDELGNPISEQVLGTFRHGRNDIGDEDERVLEFVPRLPTNDSFTNGGLKPGRTYVISIIGSNSKSSATLRDTGGRLLSDKSPIQSMRFTTAPGTTPKELFADRTAGGPRVLGVDVTPRIGDRVSLNDLAGAPVEVSIRFNQTINPSSSNVPVGQNLDPINDAIRRPGLVFLEYDDPEFGTRRWIRGNVEVPLNDLSSATVTIRPDGVLPNNATIRVIVEDEFQDVSGESNVNNSAYSRVVGTFRTEERFPAQFDAVVFDFESSDLLDPRATFRDPVADIEDGVLQASFDFEGITTVFDFRPSIPTVELNTEFARVLPSNGPEVTVIGGVFRFNDVVIPRGTVVRGTGKNPMVWLATGDFRVDGELRVDGGDGADVTTLNSANLPTAGGRGSCGGGNGGLGSPETTTTSQKGQNGFGAGGIKDGGGGGGEVACGAAGSTDFGSGGGGGSHSVKGDPGFSVFANDPLASGIGGAGNVGLGQNARAVPGGLAGPRILADDDPDNDFWGRLLDKDGAVIFGELTAPVAGSGGGGGGDRTKAANCVETNFFNDEKGGGGGGGAGVLIVKALGRIIVGPKGLISANGGNGGGGEDLGTGRLGGGGGGGSGGMVVLSSSQGIDIYQHGGLWANRDTEFAITADGGIGINRAPNARTTKYPTAGGGRVNNGGYGGLGIIQLMAPAGQDKDNGGAGTGNPQDDFIRYLDSGDNEIQNKTGMLVNGELRPNPVIMPVTYGRNSTFESRFVSTGATVRRVVSNALGQARATTTTPAFEPTAENYGPAWFFNGLEQAGASAGFLRTTRSTGLLDIPVKTINSLSSFQVVAADATVVDYRAQSAYRVRLDGNRLPDDGSLVNHIARLRDGSGKALADFRMLGATANELFLDAREGAMPAGVASLQILEKFVEVFTDGQEGLGPIFDVGTDRYPIANVQLGFAFHKDPSKPDIVTQGNTLIDRNRFPAALNTYVYDLETDGSSAERELLRKAHFPFAKIQVRFNLNYNPADPSLPGPNTAGPTSSRPALRFVRLPYSY